MTNDLAYESGTSVVISQAMCLPKSVRAAVGFMTSQLIFSSYYRSHVPQIRNGSVKECEVDMGDCWRRGRVYCEDGRRRGPWVGAR